MWSRLLSKKWIVLLWAGTLAGCAAAPEPDAALRGQLELQSTRRLLEWLIDRRPLSGFDHEPGTAWIIDQADRIFVFCDYLDPELPLSSDLRVKRLTPRELDASWQQYAYDKTIYVWLSQRYAGSNSHPVDDVGLSLKYSFGNVGAHRYEFTFSMIGDALRAEGFLAASS